MRGRYAPSPTGELHLGNASTALLAWLSVRARSGRFVLRMEDLDRGRSREPLARQILDDLHWLGLDWEEGPDRGGLHAPYEQSGRARLYGEALARLVDGGRLYPCFCTRRDIAAAASAPHESGTERRYPGTCAGIDAETARERMAEGRRYAWRFRPCPDAARAFDDLCHGTWRLAGEPDHFVVARSDTGASYQLAVVVDDHAMQIDEVIRGDDLLASTVRQLQLYDAFGWDPPLFGHVPLLVDREGHRLSKRQQGITLRELRESGWSAAAIIGRLAGILGLRPTAEPLDPHHLIDDFDLGRIRPVPTGIVV